MIMVFKHLDCLTNPSSCVLSHSLPLPVFATCTYSSLLFVCFLHDVKNVLKMYRLSSGEELRTFALDVGSVVGFTGRKRDSEIFYYFTSFLSPGIRDRLAWCRGPACVVSGTGLRGVIAKTRGVRAHTHIHSVVGFTGQTREGIRGRLGYTNAGMGAHTHTCTNAHTQIFNNFTSFPPPGIAHAIRPSHTGYFRSPYGSSIILQ